jgi:hypothetical protein
MTPRNDLLLLAGKIITLLLQGVMAIGALALALVAPIITLFEGDILAGLSEGIGLPISQLLLWPLAGMLVIAIAILAALFLFFGKLRAIINTVGKGDPFVPANAERLSMMAWLLLAAQVLHIPLVALLVPLAAWARQYDDSVTIEADIAGFDLGGILMVLVLFILARVFRYGAALRDDLEGTV